MEVNDAERGILGAKATSAMCVQSFDDSLNSAIHITYRISLRSSSLREPRYPLLRVLDRFKGLFVARMNEQLLSHLSDDASRRVCWLKCVPTR